MGELRLYVEASKAPKSVTSTFCRWEGWAYPWVYPTSQSGGCIHQLLGFLIEHGQWNAHAHKGPEGSMNRYFGSPSDKDMHLAFQRRIFELVNHLIRNDDLFSWASSYMSGIYISVSFLPSTPSQGWWHKESIKFARRRRLTWWIAKKVNKHWLHHKNKVSNLASQYSVYEGSKEQVAHVHELYWPQYGLP